MTTTAKVRRYAADGSEVENKGPLLDGQVLRTSMSVMDHALVQQLEDKLAPVDTSLVRHQPGYLAAPVTDAQLLTSETNYAARKQKMQQAWMTPPPKPVTPPLKKDGALGIDATTPATVTAADVDAAITSRNARLENSWRAA